MTAPTERTRRRVPAWALPILLVLPLWAVLYGGVFGDRQSAEADSSPVGHGAVVYRSAGCSGCHGPSGGGSGAIPALRSTHKTFLDFADHESWVRTGSAPFKGQVYGASGRVAGGGMPSFDNLADEDIRAVVCYERVELSRAPMPPECELAGAPAP